ncbi:MAG: hypothetical protein R3C03_17735 [Pirellulaceae bacterium]
MVALFGTCQTGRTSASKSLFNWPFPTVAVESSSKTYSITIAADTVAPNVSLSVEFNGSFYFDNPRIDVGNDYVVRVTATDNVRR